MSIFGEKLPGRMKGPRLRRRPLKRESSLKGRMQNIIVVKPPNPMFCKAVFFLRDDYFSSSDISRGELLKQAEEAAANYVGENIPPVPPFRIIIMILLPAFIISAVLIAIYILT